MFFYGLSSFAVRSKLNADVRFSISIRMALIITPKRASSDRRDSGQFMIIKIFYVLIRYFTAVDFMYVNGTQS
jgi:hypothetical protein